MSDDDQPSWEFRDRDAIILAELADNPQLSARELTDILETEYDIDVSHVTVSESIREMREEGVFRRAILPNETYYRFALLEFSFNPENFADHWREAMEHIRDDPHTLFYFLADGEYHWKAVMMFPGSEAHSRWMHEFYKEHGAAITDLRNHVIHNVLKFGTDPEVFSYLPANGE